MFVITLRNIDEGEELFAEYGLKYWENRINEE
jgi:hypothetical protein